MWKVPLEGPGLVVLVLGRCRFVWLRVLRCYAALGRVIKRYGEVVTGNAVLTVWCEEDSIVICLRDVATDMVRRLTSYE